MWEPRKGKKSKNVTSHEVSGQIRSEASDSVGGPTSRQNESSSTDESSDSNQSRSSSRVKRGIRKIGSMFKRSHKDPDKISSPRESEPSPQDNSINITNTKKGGVTLIIDESIMATSAKTPKGDEGELPDEILVPESPNQRHAKDMAKSILKQAGRSARELKLSLSRKARKPKAEAVESDSMDDESHSSSVDFAVTDAGLVVPSSVISPLAPTSGDDSLKLKDEFQTADLSGSDSFKAADDKVL